MLQYHLDLVPRTHDPNDKGGRALGTLVHKLLEAYETTGDWKDLYNAIRYESADSALGPGLTDEEEKRFELAHAMLEGYVDWSETEGAIPGETTWATEYPVELYMGDFDGEKVWITGTIDRVLHNQALDEYIIDDYKTVQSVHRGEQFAMDEQLLAYALMFTEQTGFKVSTARHTMLRKVLRSSRSKPPYYGRADIYVSPSLLTSAHNNIEHLLRDMVRLMQDIDYEYGPYDQGTAAYPNITNDCSWDCDFLPVCQPLDEGGGQAAVELLYKPRPT